MQFTRLISTYFVLAAVTVTVMISPTASGNIVPAPSELETKNVLGVKTPASAQACDDWCYIYCGVQGYYDYDCVDEYVLRHKYLYGCN